MTTVMRGQRWVGRLEIYERSGDQPSILRIDVPGAFIDRAAAVRSAEGVLNEWIAGAVGLRELVLRELAAAYRHLRAIHKTMEPVAVPTTSAAWSRAIDLWELAAWLDAGDAARYREHVQRAFDPTATTVKRHRLPDVKPDAEP